MVKIGCKKAGFFVGLRKIELKHETTSFRGCTVHTRGSLVGSDGAKSGAGSERCVRRSGAPARVGTGYSAGQAVRVSGSGRWGGSGYGAGSRVMRLELAGLGSGSWAAGFGSDLGSDFGSDFFSFY